MFRPLRSNEKTRGQLLRAELSESLGHARKAAGYAAGGVRDTVGPRLAPAVQRVRSATGRADNQPKEKKVSSRRWPKLAGLAAVGALAGAVGAFILRRRREQQWESYEPGASERSSEASDAAGGAAMKPSSEAVKEQQEAVTQPPTPTAGPE